MHCAASFGSNCSHNLSTHFGWSVQLTVSMLTSANIHKYAKHKANFENDSTTLPTVMSEKGSSADNSSQISRNCGSVSPNSEYRLLCQNSTHQRPQNNALSIQTESSPQNNTHCCSMLMSYRTSKKRSCGKNIKPCFNGYIFFKRLIIISSSFDSHIHHPPSKCDVTFFICARFTH